MKMEIISKRPKGMSFDVYKEKRAQSNARLNNYLKYGRLYYLAAWIEPIKDAFGKKIGETYKTREPFVGQCRYDLKKPL